MFERPLAEVVTDRVVEEVVLLCEMGAECAFSRTGCT